MTRYRIDLSKGAKKDLRRITEARLHDRLTAAIGRLAIEPRPEGCLKLVGSVDQWRIRVGDWRIVYVIEDGRLVVLVVSVGPRGGVYG
ncbi:MAG: type II toxin-antitoxin system RelE family toxin [Gemmobacter sp.]